MIFALKNIEGKPRTPLSSRVATRVSWSPLSGLPGVQPPLPLRHESWTRKKAEDNSFQLCSSGQGPHIAMTRETRGFSRDAAGFSSYLFEGNPVGEGTTRRGTATPVQRPPRPAGSTHSSTRGLRPPEQLERPAGFPSSDNRP